MSYLVANGYYVEDVELLCRKFSKRINRFWLTKVSQEYLNFFKAE